MMYVKTKVLPSKIQGLGLFADQLIPKGTVIWKFTSNFDIKYTKEQINALPQEARDFLATYAYLSKKSGLYILPVDNAKYFNHSETPNSKSAYLDTEEEVVTTAVMDIQLGEEITDNYSLFDKTA